MKRRKDSKNRVLKEGEYERSNGTYEYKWRSRTGKRHSVYARTLAELRDKEIDILKDTYDGIDQDSSNLTINDEYKKWKTLKRGLKANTYENYKYMYEQYVMPEFGKCKLSVIKKTDIRGFYNTLYDVRGLKSSTIDVIQTVMHQIFQMAVDDDIIRNNPSDNALKELKRAHGDDIEKREALTVKQASTLIRFLQNLSSVYHHWLPIITVLLFTGMRVGEVTGLQWDDIDFENDIIDVNHTLVYYSKRSEQSKHGECKFEVHSTKTYAGNRRIPMLPVVKDAFLQEKKYQEEIGLKCCVNINGYTDFIFINKDGGCLHQGTLNKAFRRIIRDCNYAVLDKSLKDSVRLPHFSCHYMRHTCATYMKDEAHMDEDIRKEILGHVSDDVTNRVYTHNTDEYKREEMFKLIPVSNIIFGTYDQNTTDLRPLTKSYKEIHDNA